jgi:hypothetical protein
MNIDEVWTRIIKCAGQTFRQLRAKPFTYSIVGNSIDLSTTNRKIPRSDIAKALGRLPIKNTTSLQDLQAPSFVYALLRDGRIMSSM